MTTKLDQVEFKESSVYSVAQVCAGFVTESADSMLPHHIVQYIYVLNLHTFL